MNDKPEVVEEEAHSIYGPSSLPRIFLCPGSIQESTYAPLQKSSTYANRGTRLHDVVVKAVAQSSNLDKQVSWVRMRSGENFEDGEQVVDCLKYRAEILEMCGPEATVLHEGIVKLDSWGLDEVWGTCDLAVLDPVNRIVYIVDWKFGAGIKVYVKNNEQCLAYAAGATGFPNTGIDIVSMRIFQPPIDHIDQWDISYDDLKNWVFSELEPVIKLARTKGAPKYPGKKQCQFCPAAMTCRARHDGALESARQGFKVYSAMNQVSKEELVKALIGLEDCVTYRNAIAVHIFDELDAGRGFPGYKMVAGRSTRSWKDEKEAEAWLENHSSVPADRMYKPSVLISCAQAEKIDKELKKDPDFNSLVHKPEGKPKAVPEDDPRPAVKPQSTAKAVFKDVVGKED